MPISSEVLLISSILQQKDFTTATAASIAPDMFAACHEEWAFMELHYQRFHKVPSLLSFQNKFPSFRIKDLDDTAHQAEEVIKAHTRRRLMASMHDVTDYIASGDIDKAVKKMHSEIITISAEVGGGQDVDIISQWDSIYDEVEAKVRRVEQDGTSGIPTGFSTLDDKTGGPQPGEFWVFAARLAEGKSWAMMRCAATALMRGCTVQYNTLEMSRGQVSMRMHTLLSSQIGQTLFRNLDLQQGRDFNLTLYKKFLRDLKTKMSGSMHVTDGSRGRISPLTIAAQIERNKPDIVFIDYITLLEGAIGGDWKSIGQVSGELKQLAAQYQIPIIGAAQLNRANGLGKEAPGPEALAQSDAIGQDADAVVTMKKTSESVIQFRMAKYRHGPSNFKWFTEFRPGDGIFEECTYERALDLKDIDKDREDAEGVKVPTGERPVAARGDDSAPSSKPMILKKRPAVTSSNTSGKALKRSTDTKPRPSLKGGRGES